MVILKTVFPILCNTVATTRRLSVDIQTTVRAPVYKHTLKEIGPGALVSHNMTCLLHVDTLPTRVWPSEDLHPPLVKVQDSVIWDKRRHTQFLQRMPEEQGLSHKTQHPHPTPHNHNHMLPPHGTRGTSGTHSSHMADGDGRHSPRVWCTD